MLNEIVNVSITRETTAVTQKGFGIVMILGAHKVFNERLRQYTSASAMLVDGFTATDPEYLAAVAAFSQEPQVERIAIGRRTVNSAVVVVTSAVASTVYSITVNGTAYTFNSGASPTTTSIATGLAAAVNADAALPVTATASGANVTLAADVAGVAFTLLSSANTSITKPYTTSDSLANDLTAVSEYNDDWYGLVVTSRVQADVVAVAAWVETKRKLYLSSSSDASLLTSGSTTNVAAVLKTGAYLRSGVIYHQDINTFPEAAWFGKMLPADPGSATWAYKTLAGIAASTLTSSQSSAVRGYNANTYENIGGVNVTRFGTAASGEYLDIMAGIDWFHARLQERIYSRLVNLPKIAYTDPGIAVFDSEVRAQLRQGIDVGFLASDPEPTVTVPTAKSASTADKTARKLSNVKFTATLAGAVHLTTINGTVTV